MGNAMSCFDRWGKRAPDGALFTTQKPGPADAGIKILGAPASGAGSTAPSSSASGAGARGERSGRRRQTYSTKTGAKSETEVSSYDEGSSMSEDEDDKQSASDVRQQKLLGYRRDLTKIVKIKSHLLTATVKVTCSKDGKQLQWYKGQSKAQGDKRKPVGTLLIDKITSIKAQPDNPRALVINANTPSATTYNFTFKSKEEREAWQQKMELFQKFIATY